MGGFVSGGGGGTGETLFFECKNNTPQKAFSPCTKAAQASEPSIWQFCPQLPALAIANCECQCEWIVPLTYAGPIVFYGKVYFHLCISEIWAIEQERTSCVNWELPVLEIVKLGWGLSQFLCAEVKYWVSQMRSWHWNYPSTTDFTYSQVRMYRIVAQGTFIPFTTMLSW